MIVGEYLERFAPSVSPKTRVTEIEGEAKKFAGEVKVFEGEMKVVVGKVNVVEGKVVEGEV